jgi:hypothetical protein
MTGELKMSKEMSDFQKSFFARGVGNTLFTQKEFDDALASAKAEIMVVAIETTKRAIFMEREACAKICDDMVKGLEGVDVPLSVGVALEKCADEIRDRSIKR